MQSPDSTYLKTTFSSDGNWHSATGVVASQRPGVQCLELCATVETNDLIEEHCVVLLCVCLFDQTSPTHAMHSSPPKLETTVLLAAA